MNTKQKQLVQSSFQQVIPIADTTAHLFYSRLFVLDPRVRTLFKGDMEQQGKKLMQTLQTAVSALDDLEAIVPVLQALGRRHVAYGVRDEHYATVGEALLWTLEQGLGKDFTPEVRAAWVAVYTLLSDVMRQGPNAIVGEAELVKVAI